MDFSELITTPKLGHVILHRQLKPPICGTMCITFSHLIVSSRNEESSDDGDAQSEFWVGKSVIYIA
jgi:hypothetical protein